MIKKLTRRHFFRYSSNGLVSAALYRTFLKDQAFGIASKPKLVICTSPNGHYSFDSTKNALSKNLSGSASKNALYIQGLSNACAAQDWHGAEGALLSFSTTNVGPSFYTAIPGLTKAYLDIGVGNAQYARDSSGGQVSAFTTASSAMSSLFSGTRLALTNQEIFLLQSGDKSILDPCLEDIATLKSMLGSDGAIFDDYLYSLHR